MSAPRLGAQLVHVDVISSLAARALPGDDLPEWADDPTGPGELPVEVTLRNWRESHVMALLTVSKTRAEVSGAPALAVAVTIGALYRVVALPPTDVSALDVDDVVGRLPESSAFTLAKTALDDAAPFARQAVHTASTTVDPLHPLLITGLGPADRAIFPLAAE